MMWRHRGSSRFNIQKLYILAYPLDNSLFLKRLPISGRVFPVGLLGSREEAAELKMRLGGYA